MFLWGELTPINGTWDGATHPCVDNERIQTWTNFASSGAVWNAGDGTHCPTNFVSGGGGNGTSPRISFSSATVNTVLNSGAISPTTDVFSFLAVVHCNRTTGDDYVLNGSGTTTSLRFSAGTLKVKNNGTEIAGPATIGTGWYIVSFTKNAAAVIIYTNGVQYFSGNVGTVAIPTAHLFDEANSVINTGFHGDGSRIWGWRGILSGAEMAAAVAQCKTDFGIQ
jgi:hypothetical protein